MTQWGIMFVPTHTYIGSLARRSAVYGEMASMFQYLTDIETTRNKKSSSVKMPIQTYPEDVKDELLPELEHFHEYQRLRQKNKSH